MAKLFVAESYELKKSFLITFSLYSFPIFKVSKIAAKLYKESPFKIFSFILNFPLNITVPWYMVIHLTLVHFPLFSNQID